MRPAEHLATRLEKKAFPDTYVLSSVAGMVNGSTEFALEERLQRITLV
jgi:hypothetical protein